MTLDFLREFEFFAGVPDSQLKALRSFLMDKYGLDPARHVIAANEGNAAALAADNASMRLNAERASSACIWTFSRRKCFA